MNSTTPTSSSLASTFMLVRDRGGTRHSHSSAPHGTVSFTRVSALLI
jgi:hypothetical protein